MALRQLLPYSVIVAVGSKGSDEMHKQSIHRHELRFCRILMFTFTSRCCEWCVCSLLDRLGLSALLDLQYLPQGFLLYYLLICSVVLEHCVQHCLYVLQVVSAVVHQQSATSQYLSMCWFVGCRLLLQSGGQPCL